MNRTLNTDGVLEGVSKNEKLLTGSDLKTKDFNVDEALEEIENRRDPQLISIPEYLRTIKKHVSFETAKIIAKRAVALSIESAKPMSLEEDIKFGTVRTYNTAVLEAAYVDVVHKPQL